MDEGTFRNYYHKFMEKYPKTSTRWRVIELKLLRGTDAQIATELGKSENTVGKYLSDTYGYFQVKNMIELRSLFERYDYIWNGENSEEIVTGDTDNFPQFHNLTHRLDRQLIGRDRDIERILSSMKKHDRVWLKGMGGCGKTTLLLEIAHRYLNPESQFNAIVYISAQTESLTYHQRTALPAQRTRKDIYRQIFNTFNCGEVMYANMGESSEAEIYQQHLHPRLCELLAKHRTLLIFDNFDDQEKYEVLHQVTYQIPSQTQILVGSRQIFGGNYYREDLPELEPEDAKVLIKKCAHNRNQTKLKPKQIERIFEYTKGLPLAIEIIVGLTAIEGRDGRDIDLFLQKNPVTNDLLGYCLDLAIEQLKKYPRQLAYQLLQIIALFTNFASKEAVIAIARLTAEPLIFQEAIERLTDLSLIQIDDRERYHLHPIVYTYVNHLFTHNLVNHNHLRDRWVEWYYQKFACDYDDRNWQDWQDYTAIESEWKNLCAVVDWCFDRDRYSRCLEFWKLLKGFTLFCGYWDERKQWLQWLMTIAENDPDSQTLPLVQYHQSLTLCYRDEIDRSGEAMELAKSAWESNIDFADRFYLLTHIASLYIKKLNPHQRDSHSLIEARKFLAAARNFKPNLSDREAFVIEYYESELESRLGNLNLALSLSNKALDLARKSQYQRYIIYTEGRIAKILMHQGKLTAAEVILNRCLNTLEQNRDRRALAFCYAYLMELKFQQRDRQDFLKWRSMAIKSFKNLNMQTEMGRLNRMKFDQNS